MKEKLTPRPKTCLEAINQHLESLGSTARWKKTPDDLPEYQPLHRKKVLLVDDQSIVIEQFIPHLIVATENNFSFILCNPEDTIEELARKITTEKTKLVLLDYHISPLFKGTDLARRLVKTGYKGLVVGFSSDQNSKQHWTVAKVYATVEKKADEPITSIKALGSIALELDEPDKTRRNYALKRSGYLSLEEMEIRGDKDSGTANFQIIPSHGDANRAEREDAILYLAECVNTMMVYKTPQEDQKSREIDMAKTKTARENYLKSKEIPIKSIFYPKGYGITRDENDLLVFGKIK